MITYVDYTNKLLEFFAINLRGCMSVTFHKTVLLLPADETLPVVVLSGTMVTGGKVPLLLFTVIGKFGSETIS